MKTLFSFALVVLFSYSLNAQGNSNLLVEYKIYYNTEFPNVKTGKLIVDRHKNQSLFTISSAQKKEEKEVEVGLDSQIKFRTIANKKRFVYCNATIDSIYASSKLYRENYLIKEKMPKMKWALTNEEKSIDGIKVKKAILNFRGRKYIAWYNTDYPVRFGPWKFHGLPGLIFEIYDESHRYHWVLNSISNSSTPFSFAYNKEDYKEVSLEEYVEIRYEQKPNILSKLPRGVRVESREVPARNSMEIKFEWEEEAKKE